MEVLKVSSNTKVNSLAGAIAGTIREEGTVEMSAIGAGAVIRQLKQSPQRKASCHRVELTSCAFRHSEKPNLAQTKKPPST